MLLSIPLTLLVLPRALARGLLEPHAWTKRLAANANACVTEALSAPLRTQVCVAGNCVISLGTNIAIAQSVCLCVQGGALTTLSRDNIAAAVAANPTAVLSLSTSGVTNNVSFLDQNAIVDYIATNILPIVGSGLFHVTPRRSTATISSFTTQPVPRPPLIPPNNRLAPRIDPRHVRSHL